MTDYATSQLNRDDVAAILAFALEHWLRAKLLTCIQSARVLALESAALGFTSEQLASARDLVAPGIVNCLGVDYWSLSLKAKAERDQ